jgi:hypothetical protein
MRMTAASLLFAMAVTAWGRVALERLVGDTTPAASLGQILSLLGVPAPPPDWEWLAACCNLEAGTAAFAAALALAVLDTVLSGLK